MKNSKTRKITVTAMLSATATILMYIQLPIAIMPSFIKLDISELPALIASMALGPWWGVGVCAVKNILHALISSSGYIGEISNFLLGIMFVLPAGYIYKAKKTKGMAFLSLAIGSLVMAIGGFFTNYYIIYPLYDKFMLPINTIINMYSAILPMADTLWECLLIFNVPFTFIKGLLCTAVMMLIYKKISYLIKGRTE